MTSTRPAPVCASLVRLDVQAPALVRTIACEQLRALSLVDYARAIETAPPHEMRAELYDSVKAIEAVHSVLMAAGVRRWADVAADCLRHLSAALKHEEER